MNGAIISGSVEIGTGVVIGIGAKVLQGLLVNQNSTIGAGAVVTKNVNPMKTMVGVPARPLH